MLIVEPATVRGLRVITFEPLGRARRTSDARVAGEWIHTFGSAARAGNDQRRSETRLTAGVGRSNWS